MTDTITAEQVAQAAYEYADAARRSAKSRESKLSHLKALALRYGIQQRDEAA